MDCPTEKVPQMISEQGCDRVTVAVFVDFPPEPFYFPSVTHLDFALRYKSKDNRKGALITGLDLDENGQWKDARGTYKKRKLTTYNNSIPVQELLKGHRWKAFQDGQWGNLPNPDIPVGDVRLATRTAEAGPVESREGIELPPVSAPDSRTLRGIVPSVKSQSLRQAVPLSDQEEVAEEDMELKVPASPPRTLASSDAKLAQAITDIVLQVRKTVATTPSVVTSHQGSQASVCTPRGPPTTQIPRVTTTAMSHKQQPFPCQPARPIPVSRDIQFPHQRCHHPLD